MITVFAVCAILLFALSTTVFTADLTVSSCTTLETEFTVVSGVAGGMAYIEGTTNAACVLTLAGDATDVSQLTYTTCGVTPSYLTSSNTLDFWVVVTETAYSNKQSDDRFHVRCVFQESSLNVDIQVEAETNDKSGTEKKHNNLPQAEITLSKEGDNGTWEIISYSQLVTMGDNLKLRFDLNPQLPEYELRVDECFFEAKDKQTSESVSSIDLLDSTLCPIYPVFPEFTYANETTTSDAGNSFDTPYAENTFQAFIPLTVSRALALVNLDLVIGCLVSVCFRSSDCTLPTCDAGRRRRETGSNGLEENGNTTHSWLYEGFRMHFVNGESGQRDPDNTNNDVIPTEPGTNDVCLDKMEFWAILLSLLFLLVGTCLGFCCFVLYSRRHRRNRRRKAIYVSENVTPSVTKTTTLSSISSQSSSIPQLLPRLVPVSLNGSGKRSSMSAC